MSHFAAIRLPHEILFGKGQRHALPKVALRHGTRALICTDQRFAGTATFAEILAALEDASISVFIHDGVLPDVPKKLGFRLCRGSTRVRAGHGDRDRRRKLPGHGKVCGPYPQPWRPAAGLLWGVQSSWSDTPRYCHTDDSWYRLGGLRRLRWCQTPTARSRWVFPAPTAYCRCGHLRSRIDHVVPCGFDSRRGRRRADPCHRRLSRRLDAAPTHLMAQNHVFVGKERAD